MANETCCHEGRSNNKLLLFFFESFGHEKMKMGMGEGNFMQTQIPKGLAFNFVKRLNGFLQKNCYTTLNISI